MQILIRSIPKDTHPNELHQFILPSLDKRILSSFRTPGELISVKVFAQKDSDFNIVSHHGLATIEPDKAAKRSIKRLFKTPFKGTFTIIREFVHRSWQNDRRCHRQANIRHINSRRKADRRQHNLEMVTEFGVKFSGLKQFSRKTGF